MQNRYISSLDITEKIISTSIEFPEDKRKVHPLLKELAQIKSTFTFEEEQAYKKHLENRFAQEDKIDTLKFRNFILGSLAIGMSTTALLKYLMIYDPSTAFTHFLSNAVLGGLIGIPTGITVAQFIDPTAGDESKVIQNLIEKLKPMENNYITGEATEDGAAAAPTCYRRRYV
ncbi:MAG: hypothetical protein P4M12_04790 [Gammaproteobacteria bacterium]|nr:hypothetical protein [Gammaproteobacteria bacterium]